MLLIKTLASNASIAKKHQRQQNEFIAGTIH